MYIVEIPLTILDGIVSFASGPNHQSPAVRRIELRAAPDSRCRHYPAPDSVDTISARKVSQLNNVTWEPYFAGFDPRQEVLVLRHLSRQWTRSYQQAGSDLRGR